MSQVPTIGRIVHYTLTDADAADINRRRKDAEISKSADDRAGYILHVGNHAEAGQVFPMTITRVWGGTPQSAVNGQVHLDGADLLWKTSVSVGDGEGHFAWPTRG